MQQILLNKRGNTLVETIIYLGIITIFFLSTIGFATSVIKSGQKARTIHEVSQNGRFILERITREIKTADDLNTGSSTFGSHPGVLSILHDEGTKDPTVFDVSAGVVRITQGAGGPASISSDLVNVTNLVFTDLGVTGKTKNIQIDLTLEWRDSGSATFNTSITMKTSVVIREEED